MSTEPAVDPEQVVKARLEDAVREWTEYHHDTAHVIVEYLVVVKTYNTAEPGPARFLYGWRKGPDSDALLGMIARVKRYLLRSQL